MDSSRLLYFSEESYGTVGSREVVRGGVKLSFVKYSEGYFMLSDSKLQSLLALAEAYIESSESHLVVPVPTIQALMREIIAAREMARFYAGGWNPNLDVWKHDELGYFTGRRAREYLKEFVNDLRRKT